VENQNQLKEATKELQKLDAALQQLTQTLRLKTSDLGEYNRELEGTATTGAGGTFNKS
jgi:chromosome segregation ATPase